MARNHFLHVLIAGGIIGPIGLLAGCDLPDPDSSDEAIGVLAEENDDELDELQSEDQAAEPELDLSAFPAPPSTPPAHVVGGDALGELQPKSQSAGLETGLDLSAVPAPPSMAKATKTGSWYKVCAQDLTVYNNGPIGTLYNGAWFWVDHFGGDNHVWGSGTNNGGKSYYWGWVTNGWFC